MKYYDKLIFELSKPGRTGYSLPAAACPSETSGCAGPLPSDDGPLPLTMPRVARFPEAVTAPAMQAVIWWPQNWRKGGLQERRNAVIREQGFYNQNWCGCEFSRNNNPLLISI